MVNLPVPVADPLVAQLENSIAGQLAPSSQILYRRDMATFAKWLSLRNISLDALTRDDIIAYRAYLGETYAKATASRMLTVARRVAEEAYHRGMLDRNPA